MYSCNDTCSHLCYKCNCKSGHSANLSPANPVRKVTYKPCISSITGALLWDTLGVQIKLLNL